MKQSLAAEDVMSRRPSPDVLAAPTTVVCVAVSPWLIASSYCGHFHDLLLQQVLVVLAQRV
jgi:hypothetical protein